MGHSDTSLDALRAQYDALRKLSPTRRLELVDDLTELARSMTMAGLRHRNPEASPEQLEVLFFEIALGRELATRVLAYREQVRGRHT